MQLGILYPLASLKWKICKSLPVGMCDAQAVWLKDKLYVGGVIAKSFVPNDALYLYVYYPNTDTWCTIDTPVCWFALATYHSQLVVVGGWEYTDKKALGWGVPTNKLLVLREDDKLDETLIPPMITERFHASSVEYKGRILVAGGYRWEMEISDIEIYDRCQWTKTQFSLPQPCCKMKSAILKGFWYLMGGETQGNSIYCASLDALVADLYPQWKKLKDVPHKGSSPAVFRDRLMVIGGGTYATPAHSSIYTYSANTQSWILEGEIPEKLHSTCTAILPDGKLAIIGGQRFDSRVSSVYQAVLNGKH